jgi:hypothetical protein
VTPRKHPLMLKGSRRFCHDCRTWRPIENFGPHKPRCMKCRWAREKQQTRDRLEEKYRLLNDYKVEQGCVDCGYNINPIALAFDHRPGVEKLFSVSVGVTRNYVMSRIWVEVAKCDVRCANCHMIITHERRHAKVVF